MSKQDDWDVFISHASEDKMAVARPLFQVLSEMGLKVWYDEAQITVGDSLSKAIDNGLARSSFGILIISKHFLNKKWPDYEFRGLIAKEMSTGKTILPIWHDVSVDEVVSFSPTLADKFAVKFDPSSVSDVAMSILKVAKPHAFEYIQRRQEYQRKLTESRTEVLDFKLMAPGPIIHGEIPERVAVQVKLIWLTLSEADPSSFKQWIENFRRDAHPTNEIAIWTRIASAFLDFKRRSRKWGVKKAKAAYEFLLFTSMSKNALPQRNHKHLTDQDVKLLAALFDKPFTDEIRDFLSVSTVTDEGVTHRNWLGNAEVLDENLSDADFIESSWAPPKVGR